MAKAIKLADIAKQIGVSTVTVSKALSGQKGVGEELRMQIVNLADEMGYVRLRTAEKERKSYTVGVVVAERYLQESQSFYWKLYQEMAKKAITRSCFTMLEVIGYEIEKKLELPKIASEKKADGIIVIGDFKAEYMLFLEEKLAIPFINVDTTNAGEGCDSVVFNNMMGGYRMTNYLFEMGHKKIGFVGTRLVTSSIDDRYLGYVKSLMEHGERVEEDWIIDDRDREFGKVDYERRFHLPENMPTAFFCNCDLSAGLMIRKLTESGYKVPDDVSVVGFDNYVSNQLEEVKLTTYEINTTEMAKRAVHILLHKIDNAGYTGGMFMLGGTFIERESAIRVGPPVPVI